MPLEIDFVTSYDRDSLIQELRRTAGALGKTTLSRREIDAHARVSSRVVIRRFGSLREALQQSGLIPGRFGNATDEELCGILIELWTRTVEEFGRSPYSSELSTYGYPVSSDTYRRRFGSWNNSLLAAAESVSASEDTLDAMETTALPLNQ